MTELLLCTNGSADSRVALRLGVCFALALRLPVVILGIVESPKRRKEVTQDVARTAEQLRDGGIIADSRLVSGDAQQIIPAEAVRGDFLVVVGALEHPLWRRLLRGPTMRHLLDVLEGPVLCSFHAQETTAVEKVLICSGGLHHADAAIDLGGRIAAAFTADVTLLHVATPHANMPAHLQDLPDASDSYLHGDTIYAHNLQQTLAHLEGMGLSVEFQVRAGDPLLEILKMVHGDAYDLVVIGSHAAVTGPAKLIGDITSRIVEGAGRPVLIV